MASGRVNVCQEDPSLAGLPPEERPQPADALLLERIRGGDADAAQSFVHDYYPGIYRYLLYLTGRRELAEDLTQETFVQAWRHLDRFVARAPLRAWLHRIAHREFLQALRSQRPVAPLEETAAFPLPSAMELAEAMELRAVIGRLPVEERETLVLHHLEGYTYEEIAQITGAPVRRVKRRLAEARARLQRELGEGDLPYLNPSPAAILRQWEWLPLEALTALEARLSFPAKASEKGERRMSDKTQGGMSRRKLLEAAGTAAAAVAAAGLAGPTEAATSARNEAEIVDERLTRKVTLAVKATALADLCEQLRSDTGIALAAGPSVADEKVTVFCEKQPLRDVMRQLSRPFGYTWLRSRKEGGEYRYELVQDLRSQLLEEELRNRDRNAALLALQAEIDRYRPYLNLSPDEALARAKTASPAEKPLLEKLARYGWGPLQRYFRLSPQEQAALRAGQPLTFSAAPLRGQHPLPPEIGRGVLQSFRDHRLVRHDSGFDLVPAQLGNPEAVSLTASEVGAEVGALVTLSLQQNEPGQFTLDGHSGLFSKKFYMTWRGGPYAVGTGAERRQGAAALKSDNRAANARWANDPVFRPRVTLQAQPSCCPPRTAQPGDGSTPEPRATTADALEALHRATRLPLVADYYTRLYEPRAVAVQPQPLFDALNRLADAMRLRWHKDENWLQFRSASYYDDRLKEVPNRLLARWSAARRQHGALTLDDLIEIAELPDAQLDAKEMAEGTRECAGLVEWDLARNVWLRPHLRYLAGFTPAQRQEVMGATGLAFTKMSLAQQQQFIAFTFPPDEEPILAAVRDAGFDSPRLLEELKQGVLRVEYTQPGWFQWGNPALSGQWFRWVVAVEPGRQGKRVLRPPVRERTREAALQAVRRLDPQLREAAVHQLSLPGQAESERPIPLEEQIFPSELGLTIVYIPGPSNALLMRILNHTGPSWQPSG
jgi:RNA polymerase sigma-70 factor (ECF subfamily)